MSMYFAPYLSPYVPFTQNRKYNNIYLVDISFPHRVWDFSDANADTERYSIFSVYKLELTRNEFGSKTWQSNINITTLFPLLNLYIFGRSLFRRFFFFSRFFCAPFFFDTSFGELCREILVLASSYASVAFVVSFEKYQKF